MNSAMRFAGGVPSPGALKRARGSDCDARQNVACAAKVRQLSYQVCVLPAAPAAIRLPRPLVYRFARHDHCVPRMLVGRAAIPKRLARAAIIAYSSG